MAGKELSGGTSPMVHGFQLIALPPELERAEPEARIGATCRALVRPASRRSENARAQRGSTRDQLLAGHARPASNGRYGLLAVTPLRGSRLARARSAAASGPSGELVIFEPGEAYRV